MAEEIKRVIEVDATSSSKTIRELREEIEKLKKALSELTAGTKEFAEAQTRMSQAQEEVNQAMEITAKDEDAQVKSMQELRAIIDENTGSFGFLVARMQELKAGIDATNARIKQITKDYDEGRMAVDDYNQELQENLEELQKLRTEQGDVRSSLNASTKALLSAKGSYVEMSQTLGQLRNAYRQLSKEQREGAVGTEMLGQIKLLDAELKDVDASMGNFQRNVGGYEEALKQVLPAQAGLIIDLGKLSVEGGGIPSLFNGMKNSIVGMTKAAVAFIATPLGMVLTALAAAAGAAFALFNARNKEIEKQAEASAKALERQKEQMDRLSADIDYTIRLLRAQGKETEANAIEMQKYKDAMTAAAFAYSKFKDEYDKMSKKEKEANEENRKALLDRFVEARDAYENYLRDLDVKHAEEVTAERKKNAELAEEQRKAAAEAVEEQRKKAEAVAESNREIERSIELMKAEQQEGTREGDVAIAEQKYLQEAEAFEQMVKEKGISAENAKAYREQLYEDFLASVEEIDRKYDKKELDRLNSVTAAENEIRNKALLMQSENKSGTEEGDVALIQEQYRQELNAFNEMVKEKGISESAAEAYRVALAEKTEASITKTKERYAKDQEKIEKLKMDTTLNVASSTLNSLSSILGTETAAGKAAAVASATIDTYKAANAAYSSLAGIPIVGPGLGAAAATAAIVAGIANVKNILSVDTLSSAAGSNISSATPTVSTPAVVTPPAVVQEVTTVRSLTGASEEERLNQMASDQRVYLVYADVEQAGKRVEVQQSDTSF